MGAVIAFAAKTALEAGNAMEASFLSARAGDRDGALEMAKLATAKAVLAKKALTTALHAQSADTATSRAALGHVEDARLFAKAATDVYRSTVRRAADKNGHPVAMKKAAETVAFLMAAATTLLDVKRGTATEVSLRKAALASERASQAAEDAVKAGGPHGEDALAAKITAGEIARRTLWAVKEAMK